jgi:hypothetical protein
MSAEWIKDEIMQLLMFVATLIVGFMTFYVAWRQKSIQEKATKDAIDLSLLEHRLKCIEELEDFADNMTTFEKEMDISLMQIGVIQAKFNILKNKIYICFNMPEEDNIFINFYYITLYYFFMKNVYYIYNRNLDPKVAYDSIINNDYSGFDEDAKSYESNPKLYRAFAVLTNLRSKIFKAYLRDEVELEAFMRLSREDAITVLGAHVSNMNESITQLLEEVYKLNFSDKVSAVSTYLTELTKGTVPKQS